VIINNLPPILHRFQVMVFPSGRFSLTPLRGMIPANIQINVLPLQKL